MQSVAFRFETLIGDTWVPAGDDEAKLDDGDDPVDFARARLDEALAARAGAATESPANPARAATGNQANPAKAATGSPANPAKAATGSPAEQKAAKAVGGVRILVWRGPAKGLPDVVIRADERQLAVGRLRQAADEVRVALGQVREARSRLRAQVLTAATTDGLSRNRIAREVESAFARRLVLQFLAGHDLVRQVRAVLPAQWPREDGPDPATGPFRCGPVELTLSGQGVVELRTSGERATVLEALAGCGLRLSGSIVRRTDSRERKTNLPHEGGHSAQDR